MKFYIYILLFSLNLFLSQTSYSQMFWNQAAQFDSSSHISVPNDSLINITGNFTLECWLCPEDVATTQMIMQKFQGLNANGYGFYLNSGKPVVRTNGTTRLIGKTALQVNIWTHVSVTYLSNQFRIYINGVLDTSANSAGAPIANSDSLLIGSGLFSAYNGKMDEIRVWDVALTASEVQSYFRSTLGVNSGIYNGLVLSIPFQKKFSVGVKYYVFDMSGNNIPVVNYGTSGLDQSDRPLTTIISNDCMEFDGSDDYVAILDNSVNSPKFEITMEAWIFPRSVSNEPFIFKSLSNGSSRSYSFSIFSGRLYAGINGSGPLYSNDTIEVNRWTHVAFTYNSSEGKYCLYVNGNLTDTGTINVGSIQDDGDSLFIGGLAAGNDFDGYIDEVRISSYEKSRFEINRSMYSSIDDANDKFSEDEAVYNMDGLTFSSADNSPQMFLRNNAKFAHAGSAAHIPVSPMQRADFLNYQEGFFMKKSDRRIPETGTTGNMINDSLELYLDENISDLNLFIAINHTKGSNLKFTLTSPSGTSFNFMSYRSLINGSGNFITVFNDEADSLFTDLKYTTFSPELKTGNSFNTKFGGESSKGIWKLAVSDDAALDTGRLYCWGLQINNKTELPKLLRTNVLIQGFYDASTNQSIRDTVRYFARKDFSPYNKVDSVMLYIPINGTSDIIFNNIQPGTNYYLMLKHRNSIETWSSGFMNLDVNTSQNEYRFISSAGQAYGNNQIQVDASPVRYSMYGCDVNQDENVDATDIVNIYNDVTAGTTGYISTDVTGDDNADVSDLILTYNNLPLVISVVKP